MKWTKPTFNNGQLPYSTDVYREDMRCIRRTLDFVRAFTATMVTKTQIRVLVPTIHRFDEESLMPNVVYLREPYISGFQKWNSNSGWVNHESEVSPLMCALSHFSYHASGGNNLLCDLQGSWVKTSNLVILTDPVIMTVGPRKFCLPDGGISGMRTFFKKHVCTKYCDPRWILPEEEVRCDDIANGSEGDQRHRYLEALSSRNLVDRAKAVSAKFARGWSTTAKVIVRNYYCLPTRTRAQRQLSSPTVKNTSNEAVPSVSSNSLPTNRMSGRSRMAKTSSNRKRKFEEALLF